ncbi:DUF2784 domain-containing protein [Rhodococcus sp. PAMC28707]|uniref:DUF2784 domain-containing protein n=1 Tax=unclassified Rhodococcus (in: high G+C Gram-positive bacteria) TaxID=192944 RepID=UPI00109DFFD4|nr:MULTISPECIES: DUF2784 domain-containing protein [unclassified Rhodococcus (in: high G+C Gram-positive bacteria)]QCB51120.1 DUF2784 domain-containing protein [Rhodococcus sp. PAMC28705]QCB57189.1 DUF2784 domain-containing protein [Rhodococcus sp. PAMC28707]
MMFRALADITVVAHLAFVVYVVAGGFLAWRYRRTIWLHGAAVAWGFVSIVIGVDCPLTQLESWARVRGGESALPSTGFIDYYLTGVLYPESMLGVIRFAAICTVAISWAGFAVLRSRKRHFSAT